MGYPTDIGVIDTMLDLPRGDHDWSKTYGALLRDSDSRNRTFDHPAGYMFKEKVKAGGADPIGDTLKEMDRFNVQRALISAADDLGRAALRLHPDRFSGGVMVDPNEGMDAVRALARAVEYDGVIAAFFFPCGSNVPIDDKRAYPIYGKCVELDIPIFINAGVPGPRMPFKPQYVGLFDEVCWFFPELKVVMRHGAEPWTDLAVKLLLKWPNLYYSTSAFAPKYFPKDIIDFANSRGADKVLYAGYYPSGLTLERSFGELPDVPFRDHVWPKFLRDNAMKLLKLDQGQAAAAPVQGAVG